jgi:hypothetical protein
MQEFVASKVNILDGQKLSRKLVIAICKSEFIKSKSKIKLFVKMKARPLQESV